MSRFRVHALGMAALAILPLVGVDLTGCTHGNSPAPSAQTAASTSPVEGQTSPRELHIGYQKGGVLNLVRLRKTLEPRLAAQHIAVQWLDFPAGPQLIEALRAGSIDVGLTGDTPPIFGQEGGVPLVYLANAPLASDGSGDGILVSGNSPLYSVADLRGKKVALQRGSSSQYVLLLLLQKGGLTYKDIQPVYMAPPDARAAFESGAVDAWAIWDPFFTVTQPQAHARVLANLQGVTVPGNFYLASPTFAKEYPEIVRTVLDEVGLTSSWALARPHDAAALLSSTVGVPVDILEQVTKRGRGLRMRPIDDAVMTLQQNEADSLVQIGILPKPIQVREDTLSPAEYAKLHIGAR